MSFFGCGDFSCQAEWAEDGTAILAVSGELDMLNADEVSHVLDRLREGGAETRLIVDLTDCRFIDSIGLSVLIAAQHAAQSPLHVVVASEALRRVFSVTGLTTVFRLHETRASAIAELAP